MSERSLLNRIETLGEATAAVGGIILGVTTVVRSVQELLHPQPASGPMESSRLTRTSKLAATLMAVSGGVSQVVGAANTLRPVSQAESEFPPVPADQAAY